MSLSTFIKLVGKALRFTVNRPLQRFNIYNRSKKYLGPDAKKFMPAPRAIGALSLNNWKPSQYPHLESGYKSIKQRRLDAINKRQQLEGLPSGSTSESDKQPKSFSETENDDDLIIEASNKLEVTKTVIKIDPPDNQQKQLLSDGDSNVVDSRSSVELQRALPKCTNLQLSDPATIWAVEKVPKGRLDVNMLQEIMINKLADEAYWTPEKIADKYNIKQSYAESLFKYLKQIRIVVSPRMAKNLDYVGKNDPAYQAAKHLIYFVDKRLRSDSDKKYDKMYLPHEQLDEEVKEVIDSPSEVTAIDERLKKIARPAPLRIGPINRPMVEGPAQSSVKQISGKKESEPKDNESIT